MRKVYYIYNPKTRTYDRIYFSIVRQRALAILRRLFVVMNGAGSFIILLLIFAFFSPERAPYRECSLTGPV